MTIYSRDELVAAIENGQQFEYLFFWGHKPLEGGGVGPSCCSQWFQAGFEVDGTHYPTAEHFMMAGKARLFNDENMFQKIIVAQSPNEAKGLGRKVKDFDFAIWDANCMDIVVRANEAKFTQNPKLGHWLCSTAPNILVEASPVDPVWGIGLHRDDPRAPNPAEWPGRNLLGFALMKARQRLLEQRKVPS